MRQRCGCPDCAPPVTGCLNPLVEEVERLRTLRTREAAYVDGSQDDLTRDLDVITDIAAGDYDPPPAA